MNIAIIMASGYESQFLAGKRQIPKDLLNLYRKEIIANSLMRFANNNLIDEIVVVTNLEYKQKVLSLIKEYNIPKIKAVISGGITRQTSVYAALKYLENFYINNNFNVIIHDAIRILVNDEVINKNIEALNTFEAVSTIIEMDEPLIYSKDAKNLDSTISIENAYIMQTPQSFKFDTILSAHNFALHLNINNSIDDACLMKLFNKDVHLIKGDKMNVKASTNDDLIIIKSIMEHFKK